MSDPNRRRFLGASMLAAAGAALPRLGRASAAPLRALAFDGLALFDPRPVARLAEELVPGHGAALMAAWRTRQFEYTWLRNSMDRYADFLQVTDESLLFAVKATGLALPPAARSRLVGAFAELEAWPDVAPVVASLQASGCRLAILSNFTAAMLRRSVEKSGLEGRFEWLLSTDLAQAYKPAARAYRLGVEAFGLPAARIGFVAFAGWDVAGAKAFGFPTYWANRLGTPEETLGLSADVTAPDLSGLAAWVAA